MQLKVTEMTEEDEATWALLLSDAPPDSDAEDEKSDKVTKSRAKAAYVTVTHVLTK